VNHLKSTAYLHSHRFDKIAVENMPDLNSTDEYDNPKSRLKNRNPR
jgi:hypothetical protein